MNTQNNGPSLTGVVDIIANSISLFQDNGAVKNINDIFINENDISTAEPYDVQIDENGNTIQMYQFTGDIDDTKVAGLESLLNYMNENFFSKDEPAVNENYYNITKKHFNEDIQNIYNIDKSKSYNIKNHRYTDDYYYNKKQFINNNIINNITKKNTINNTEHILNVKKDFSTKNYISNNYKSQIDYIENNLYKKHDNRTFNNTNNIYKHINNYSNDVTNNYKINKVSNIKKSYYNFNDDITLNKTSNSYYNDTYNITKNNNLYNVTDNQYFTKKNFNTSNITNNIKRHNHNNYEHNVIKKVHKNIKHINNYDTEINYYNKKSLNKKQYYNFYNDYFNFRKIENVSLSQQTDITNNITETNNQTINYVDDNYIKNDKIATIIIAPTPGTDNYLWIPETTDNVVPGLDSLLTYIQSKYATLTALQNSITNINNTINTEIQTLQTEIDNIENNPGTGNVSKESHYHTSHTDFMYQRNTTNNDNRRQFVIQNHYFTFQRKGNNELAIQALNILVSDLQTQINNLNSGSGGGGGDGDIGTV
jgi:hypothetical protein